MKLNKVINLQNKEAMTKTITFNELRRLKDSLPDGSTHRIADELGISVFKHLVISDCLIYKNTRVWKIN